MALRPFVIKSAFYLPTHRGKMAATGHLRYMGNPGKEDLVTVHDQDRAMALDEAAIHAKYMSERPGTEGYFGPDPNDPPDPETIQRELRSHNGIVWRHFVSVTEADARWLAQAPDGPGDLMHRAAWEAAARQVVPKMAESMGLDPTNVRWVASLHRAAGHPHLHLMLWEVEPHRARGQLTQAELRAFKRGWVSALYKPEVVRIGAEKSALRQEILEDTRTRINNRDERAFADRLSTVIDSLPGHGRISLQLAPADCKRAARDAADWLMQTVPALHEQASRYGDLAAELATHYSDQTSQHEAARQKALADIRDRLANAVLREAVKLDHQTIRSAWTEDPQTNRDMEAAIKFLTRTPHDNQAAFRLAGDILDQRDARAGRPPERATVPVPLDPNTKYVISDGEDRWRQWLSHAYYAHLVAGRETSPEITSGIDNEMERAYSAYRNPTVADGPDGFQRLRDRVTGPGPLDAVEQAAWAAVMADEDLPPRPAPAEERRYALGHSPWEEVAVAWLRERYRTALQVQPHGGELRAALYDWRTAAHEAAEPRPASPPAPPITPAVVDDLAGWRQAAQRAARPPGPLVVKNTEHAPSPPSPPSRDVLRLRTALQSWRQAERRTVRAHRSKSRPPGVEEAVPAASGSQPARTSVGPDLSAWNQAAAGYRESLVAATTHARERQRLDRALAGWNRAARRAAWTAPRLRSTDARAVDYADPWKAAQADTLRRQRADRARSSGEQFRHSRDREQHALADKLQREAKYRADARRHAASGLVNRLFGSLQQEVRRAERLTLAAIEREEALRARRAVGRDPLVM